MRLVGAFRRCNGTLGCGPLCSAIHFLAIVNALSTSRDFGALHRNKSVPFFKHVCKCYYFNLVWITVITTLHNSIRCSWCNIVIIGHSTQKQTLLLFQQITKSGGKQKVLSLYCFEIRFVLLC
jgi:hypothetical protein